MAIDGIIKDEKLQFDINREAAKISALSPQKKNEYLTGKETLPSNQRQIRACFSLGKAIEKQTKTVEDLAKQLKIIKNN